MICKGGEEEQARFKADAAEEEPSPAFLFLERGCRGILARGWYSVYTKSGSPIEKPAVNTFVEELAPPPLEEAPAPASV
jgi:hypothetical protein